MGADDLFHKRKARKANDLARRKASRAPYEKVLIVCEGEKTEPNYFNGLIDHYKLNSANVEVCGNCGSDPASVFEHARKLYKEEQGAGDAFDKVYCVFDKDAHTNYKKSVSDISKARPKSTFSAITSAPCFEYWLLLHFTYTTKPYNALPGKSACNQLIAELKKHMPDYEKNQRDIFSSLTEKLEIAKNNATNALLAAKQAQTDNPFTKVHVLVEFLQHIKDDK